MSIAIQIYTIEKTLFEGRADAVTLPGIEGELGVLETHIPLISSLKRGSIRIRDGKNVELVDIKGGFVEVQPESKVTILAD